MTERLRLYRADVSGDSLDSIGQVLASGQIANGKFVEELESHLRAFIGNEYITTTAEMSSAVSMALYMAGVRPGDEVIASPVSCLATTMPILNLFAKVVWCDVDPNTGSISPEAIEKLITPRTKAILVFHWAGFPADTETISRIANAHGLPVIDDASEALGATVAGKHIGNTGADYTVFSFYPNKHLTTIEGAAIAFRDAEEFEKGRWIKRYGIHGPSFRLPNGEINPDSDIKVPGWNSYLNNVNAAVGVCQFKGLVDRIEKHQANGAYYQKALQGLNNVRTIPLKDNTVPAYWVYTFLCDRSDQLADHLRSSGVQASKVHVRNDLYSCFGTGKVDLAGVDAFCQQALSIPSGWWIGDAQRESIVDLISEFFR